MTIWFSWWRIFKIIQRKVWLSLEVVSRNHVPLFVFFDDVFGEKEVEVSLEVIVSTQSAWPLPPQRGQKKEKKRKKRKSWSVLRSYCIHTVRVALLPPQRGQPLSSTSLPIRKHSRRFSWNFQQFDFLLTVSFCLWFRILEFSLDFFSLSPSVLIQDMLDQRHCWYLERSQH